MDMAAKFQDQTVFHMTGKRAGDGLTALTADFRPALLAPYRDLTRLRYDYPVVLIEGDASRDYMRSLSSVVGGLIAELAPRGIEGERLRKQLLRLERELRVLVAGGATGMLTELWPEAAARAAGRDDGARDVLTRAAGALAIDGEVFDCSRALTERLVTRAWKSVNAEKAGAFRLLVDHLIRKLSDILRAAFVHSQAGQQPQALKSGFGDLHRDTFDFSAMSRLVTRNVPKDELPAKRRQRIEWALAVLRSQPFYPGSQGSGAKGEPFSFEFDNCAAAIEAHRARLPRLVELVKAIAIAELEARGGYDEADHGPFFERYDEHALTADDLAQFPDYLVCIPADRNGAPENAAMMEMLSAGMPVKVLVQHGDLLEEAAIGQGHFAFGVRSARLATTAMGLGGLFILQSTSSNLYALRDRVRHGMGCRGPALFSVFSGSPDAAGNLAPYLSAAAAMKSRAFPAFTYDANAGTNWATRFSFENNRNPGDDWPIEEFAYADENLQRVERAAPLHLRGLHALRPAQRASLRRRSARALDDGHDPRGRLAAAAREPGHGSRALCHGRGRERQAASRDRGCAADAGDAALPAAVAPPAGTWRHQQFARRAGAGPREGRLGGAEEGRTRGVATGGGQLDARRGGPRRRAAAAVGAQAPAAAPAEAAPAPSPDQPWIETSRCSSCNECQNINDKLFGYNENKQAFIKDLNAGTYKEMVEAAEACQVAIIHPGKPWNPSEPGLEELLERAKPFMA